MKKRILTDGKDLALHFPSCKFLGQNRVDITANLTASKIQNSCIYENVVLSHVFIKNGIVKHLSKQDNVANFSKTYYMNLLKLDSNLFDGIKIVLAVNDAKTKHLLQTMFFELHATIIWSDFVQNVEVSSQNIAAIVTRQKADIGFAVDSTAQQIFAVNAKGQVLCGDEILYLLAWCLDRQNKLSPCNIVGVLQTNMGIENKLLALGLQMQRVSLQNFESHCAALDNVLAVSQNGKICICFNGTSCDVLWVLRVLVSIYFENKNIWLRVKENKYVQVHKCFGVANWNELSNKIATTFVDFYSLKLKSQGRILVWHRQNVVHILVEAIEKTTALVLALDLKKKLYKQLKK